MAPDRKGIMRLIFVISIIVILMIGCATVIMNSTKAEGLYSEEDAEMIAKTVWGEARGLNDYEKSLVVWCILNRYDHGGFGSSLKEIITKPYQFQGYKESFPVDEDILRLCEDVLFRWETGMEGRTLPEEYLYFHGDGKHNYFTTGYGNGETYDFSLPNPYEGERGCYFSRKEMENMTPEEMIDKAKTAVGAIAEMSVMYYNAIDRTTKLDDASKLALTIDFQRTFMQMTMGGIKNAD